jgi:hypothetical protein
LFTGEIEDALCLASDATVWPAISACKYHDVAVACAGLRFDCSRLLTKHASITVEAHAADCANALEALRARYCEDFRDTKRTRTAQLAKRVAASLDALLKSYGGGLTNSAGSQLQAWHDIGVPLLADSAGECGPVSTLPESADARVAVIPLIHESHTTISVLTKLIKDISRPAPAAPVTGGLQKSNKWAAFLVDLDSDE